MIKGLHIKIVGDFTNLEADMRQAKKILSEGK